MFRFECHTIIEIILIQNSYALNLFVVKTRRYRSFLKLKFIPLLVGLTFNKLLTTLVKYTTTANLIFLNELQKYYLETNLWFFYKYSLYNNSGLIPNNIHKSYNFWMIKNNYNLLFLSAVVQPPKIIQDLRHYTKHIRLIHFAIPRYLLRRSFIFILNILLKFNMPYINNIYNTYNFLIISHLYDFFLFYNFYYFKIHNY